MRINFECSGGFANLLLTYCANTDELSEELSQELLSLIDNSGVFNLIPSQVAPTSHGSPDVFFYQLTVNNGNRSISLSCNDITAPPALRPLLTRLQELSFNQRMKSN
jgi:hypothetical protein